MLGCFNLAEEMLPPSLLKGHTWLPRASSIGYVTRKYKHGLAIFIAAYDKFFLVADTNTIDSVSARWKCLSCRDKLVGNVHNQLIRGLAPGSSS